MVLASGCGARNLTRLGSGSLKALVVLLVMGVAAFATLKGITAVARVRWLDSVHLEFAGPALLPEWLAGHMAWPLTLLRGVLGLGLGACCCCWPSIPGPAPSAAGSCCWAGCWSACA
jgi:hypothetical protein